MQLLNERNRKFLKSSDLLPLSVLVGIGLQALVLLLLLGNSLGINMIAHKPAPSLVQLLDGKSIATEPINYNQRTPEVVRQFVKTSLGLMFTWNTKVQVADPANATSTQTVTDQGVQLNGIDGSSSRVTTASWQASFALADDFRNQFLLQIGKMTPTEVFSGTAQSVLSLESITDPKPVSDGQWQVDVVANLIVFDSRYPQGQAIPFNKSIFVSAVEPTVAPLSDNTTPIQRAVYTMRQSGLEITEMQDIDVQQLNQ